ncbi:MAG: DNA-binding protein [Candidatus Schekmanbacteria bacterium GWA2_38_9]|uniref:DNA-binding protein n=1 Tax=Candidatus Schekmanbacteria bacterium RIFCSPLOWO2_12_FULL_38_15 TaxID=1817883 RepID=A0A1F7SKB1_9BACT|nr:MAG: DNA-binding protein [Candidatus Schekmanbacteria bacterium GWA2_38_9]OGL51259.1 MAG: DNA-binding protein [Candidatus Schekmanbacteria bacterium RIFCSPLOWO2_02_FULL_38_14]OGL54210.1 MAG: DNA-binding protein [Candidatus Schekmanbacteria bacterium RIFCSPLOWO2_12_FULL_38_15]
MKTLIPLEAIEKKIYLIRGQKVMLDKDLAVLYCVKAIRLREQVKRNIKRFPEDFMFQLDEKEIDIMVSQNAIPSRKYLGGYQPYVFTEQGVAMLATVLNSERAIKVNIEVMRTFVRLRQMLASNKELAKRLDELESKYDAQFRVVFDAIRQLMTPPEPRQKQIGFLKGKEK